MADNGLSDASGGIVPGEAEDDGELDPSDSLTGDPAVPDPEMGVVDAPDRYRFATAHGTTWNEESFGDSLSARLRQEERDVSDEGPYVVDEQSEDYDGDLARSGAPADRFTGLLVADGGGLGPGLDQDQIAVGGMADESGIGGTEDAAIHYDEQR